MVRHRVLVSAFLGSNPSASEMGNDADESGYGNRKLDCRVKCHQEGKCHHISRGEGGSDEIRTPQGAS